MTFDRVNYRPVSALAVANMNSGFPNDHTNEKSRDSVENGPRPSTSIDPEEPRTEMLEGSWHKPEYHARLRLACHKSGAGYLLRRSCIDEYRSITEVNSLTHEVPSYLQYEVGTYIARRGHWGRSRCTPVAPPRINLASRDLYLIEVPNHQLDGKLIPPPALLSGTRRTQLLYQHSVESQCIRVPVPDTIA